MDTVCPMMNYRLLLLFLPLGCLSLLVFSFSPLCPHIFMLWHFTQFICFLCLSAISVSTIRKWFVWWKKSDFLLPSNVTSTFTKLIACQLTIYILSWSFMSTMIPCLGDTRKKWGYYLKNSAILSNDATMYCMC